MSKGNGLDRYVKQSLAKLIGSVIIPNEHQILVRPIILEEQLEKKTNKSSIIKLESFTKKVEGSNHTIVTEQGKIHMVQVITVGDRVKDIVQGDMLRILASMAEDMLDGMLSIIAEEPVALIPAGIVTAIIKSKEQVIQTEVTKTIV